MSNSNRELWLNRAITELRKSVFKRPLPVVKVSVGLPYGRGGKKAIGQHWHPNASDDKTGSIFISPTINESQLVLAVLVHELVHALVGNEANHGPKFRAAALDVGLLGPMRSSVAGPELTISLGKIIKRLGEYPHAKLNLGMNPIKKQSTRMVKMECGDCGYIARTALKNITAVGPLICPCNSEPMEVVLPEET